MSEKPSSDHGFSPEQPRLGDFSLEIVPKTSKFDLDTMSQDELIELRAKVEARIENTSLLDINLVKETLIQLRRAKKLQEDASEGSGESIVPMNQRAQVQNSIANILKDLAKVQMDLYDSEYLKRLQAAIIKVVKQLPKEQQDVFFDLMDAAAQPVQEEMNDTAAPAEEASA